MGQHPSNVTSLAIMKCNLDPASRKTVQFNLAEFNRLMGRMYELNEQKAELDAKHRMFSQQVSRIYYNLPFSLCQCLASASLCPPFPYPRSWPCTSPTCR